MEKISFEQMPEAIVQLANMIQSLEETVLQAINLQPSEPVNQWLSLKELCDYLPDKPAKQTVYGWISAGKIPYYKNGKKLRFSKFEIDGWLSLGKHKSEDELQAEAKEYLNRKKRR